MNERLEATVSGRVQMVMYRDFAQRKASRLSLTGEVRNLPNGTVHVIAEGARKNLDTYLTKLKKGSWLAHVDSVAATYTSATEEYAKFIINYD